MPESGDSSGKTKVNVGYPFDVFNHGVKGVDPLVRDEDPIAVSDSDLKKLRDAAKKSGVPLEES